MMYLLAVQGEFAVRGYWLVRRLHLIPEYPWIRMVKCSLITISFNFKGELNCTYSQTR